MFFRNANNLIQKFSKNSKFAYNQKSRQDKLYLKDKLNFQYHKKSLQKIIDFF